MNSWTEIAIYLRSTYEVTQEFETGAIVQIQTAAGPKRALVSMMNPGYGCDDYVTIDIGLGPDGVVNTDLAAKSATNDLAGGLRWGDGYYFLRNARAVGTLTQSTFRVAVSQLEGAAIGYFIANA